MSSTLPTDGRSFSRGRSAKRKAFRLLYLLCLRKRWPDHHLAVASNTGRPRGRLRLRTLSALCSLEATCTGSRNATVSRMKDCGKSTGGVDTGTKFLCGDLRPFLVLGNCRKSLPMLASFADRALRRASRSGSLALLGSLNTKSFPLTSSPATGHCRNRG